MKKGRIFTNCIVAVCTLIAMIALASCSADSNSSYGIDDSVIKDATSKTEVPFSVVLKA